MFAPVGVVLAHLFVTFPYMLGAVKPVLDELDVTYEEAAYTIGCSRWQTFRFVILPALRGGLFTGALLTFAHSLGEFGATVMVSGNLRLRTQTAPLYIFAQFEAGNIAAANAVAAVLALLSFVDLLPPAPLHAEHESGGRLMSIVLDKLVKRYGGQVDRRRRVARGPEGRAVRAARRERQRQEHDPAASSRAWCRSTPGASCSKGRT